MLDVCDAPHVHNEYTWAGLFAVGEMEKTVNTPIVLQYCSFHSAVQ